MENIKTADTRATTTKRWLFYKFEDGAYYVFPFEFDGAGPQLGIYKRESEGWEYEVFDALEQQLEDYSSGSLITTHDGLNRIMVLDEMGKAEIVFPRK